MTTDRKVELVFYAGSSLLEGPHWDAENQLLYMVAIEDEQIYALDPETQEITTYQTKGPVGCAVIGPDGMIWSAEHEGIFHTDPKTKQKEFFAQANEDPRMRYNDGKLDPRGRLLVGTMGLDDTYEEEAALYAVEKDGSIRTVVDGLTLSNGLAWTADGKTMYLIDTPTGKVSQYGYNVETGSATFAKHIVEITDGGGPDGMCIDSKGNIWVAQYGGQKVSKWNPATGEKLDEIIIPVKNATSCCIGGKNMDYLYITSAKDGEVEEEAAGGLFRVKLSS